MMSIPRTGAAATSHHVASQLMPELMDPPASNQMLQSVPEDDLLAQMMRSVENAQPDVCSRYDK
ncbi:MAG: hypothetical protein FD143_3149 [Ignavibacteria bacterium]|nr:MAG: hypothetical protein FD143_3149 [Ignavibacteria bacterium]KAF0153749.1 MAG: hypothetical protein FD188_3353 [Ignavibacteria bacterium]